MLGIIILGVLLTISVLQITYYMVTIKEDLEHNKAMEKEWEKYQSELNVDGGDVYLFDD